MSRAQPRGTHRRVMRDVNKEAPPSLIPALALQTLRSTCLGPGSSAGTQKQQTAGQARPAPTQPSTPRALTAWGRRASQQKCKEGLTGRGRQWEAQKRLRGLMPGRPPCVSLGSWHPERHATDTGNLSCFHRHQQGRTPDNSKHSSPEVGVGTGLPRGRNAGRCGRRGGTNSEAGGTRSEGTTCPGAATGGLLEGSWRDQKCPRPWGVTAPVLAREDRALPEGGGSTGSGPGQSGCYITLAKYETPQQV